jgi:hypothetical protein
MNAQLAVQLVDFWFDKDYLKVVDLLKARKEIAFVFLEALLVENEEHIVADYNYSLM